MIVANECTQMPGHSFTSAVLVMESRKPRKWKETIKYERVELKWKKKCYISHMWHRYKLNVIVDTFLSSHFYYVNSILFFVWIMKVIHLWHQRNLHVNSKIRIKSVLLSILTFSNENNDHNAAHCFPFQCAFLFWRYLTISLLTILIRRISFQQQQQKLNFFFNEFAPCVLIRKKKWFNIHALVANVVKYSSLTVWLRL